MDILNVPSQNLDDGIEILECISGEVLRYRCLDGTKDKVLINYLSAEIKCLENVSTTKFHI